MNKMNNDLLQQIIAVPKRVCDTQFIKIVAVNTGEPHIQGAMKWEYRAICHDPINPDTFYTQFNVTKKEVEKWLGVIE